MPDVRPDIREVYEMVTKQKPSDMGALERQRTRQIRTMRNRRVGAFAVVAAIVVAALAVIMATRPGEKGTTTGGQPSTSPADPVEVAIGFVEAYGALDADRATAFLSDDADISGLISSLGASGMAGTPQELSLQISWLNASGYVQLLDSCRETGGFAFPAVVRCTFDFQNLRSDEVGLGPWSGSYFDLTVRDGQIIRASEYWETAGFSGQMWEPFARWVSRAYPVDAAVMYQDESHGGVRLTPESIRLWERHTRGYVKHVKQNAGQ
jgi:hypothetical protein